MSEDGAGDAGLDTGAAPAADPAPAANGDWQSAFGDVELSGPTAWNEFKSPDDFVKSYNSAQEMISRGVERYPSEDAGDEARQAWREKVLSMDDKIMATPANYAPPPEQPDGYAWTEIVGHDDADSDAAFAKVAHEFGLTSDQANGIRQYLVGSVQDMEKESSAARTEAYDALVAEWGKDGGFDRNMDAASNATGFLNTAIPGLIDWMRDENLTQDPMMIRLMHHVADRMGEPQARDTGSNLGPLRMTRQEAEERISEMNRNRDTEPAFNPSMPGHMERKEYRDHLYRIARSN